MSKDGSSGIGTPNSGEMKGKHSNLAKRQLYKNELHGKHLKAPKMDTSIALNV